jgi:hypothetical protein
MTGSGDLMTESKAKADPEMVKAMLAKLQERLVPKLQDSKIRRRTVVAVKVLSIVDRRIAKGLDPQPGEWDDVRSAVHEKPAAIPLIDAVEAAVEKYALDLKEKLKDGDAENEAGARQAAAGLIRATIMSKLKDLREDDEEAEAAADAAEAKVVEAKVVEAEVVDEKVVDAKVVEPKPDAGKK